MKQREIFNHINKAVDSLQDDLEEAKNKGNTEYINAILAILGDLKTARTKIDAFIIREKSNGSAEVLVN